MALVDRLGKESSPGAADNLNAHAINSGQVLQARGHVTKAQVTAVLALQAGDHAQWDLMQAWAAGGADEGETALRLLTLDATVTGLELGFFDVSFAATILTNEGAI